jgi:hypothetical protein
LIYSLAGLLPADIRHILTIAQTHAIASQLKLITFDGDQVWVRGTPSYGPFWIWRVYCPDAAVGCTPQTLYPDGDNFRVGKLGTLLVKLIAAGVLLMRQ